MSHPSDPSDDRRRNSFIRDQNIADYRRRLSTETDKTMRKLLIALLDEEQAAAQVNRGKGQPR